MANVFQRLIRQRIAFGSLEEEVFVGLQLAADRVMEPWARYLRREVGLTHVQYNVLRVVRGAGREGVLAGELGCRLISRSPDVTRLVDRLESRGLVERREDAEDRRAVRIHLTEAGQALLAPLDAETRRQMAALLAPVERARLQELRDGLEAVLEVVSSGDER